MPSRHHCLTSSAYGSTSEIVEHRSLRCLSRSASVASSGSGRVGSSHPAASAARRTLPSLRRPISPAFAIARSVSPDRIRIKTCLYSYISNFRLATRASWVIARPEGRSRMSKIRISAHWLLYADHGMAP